MNIYQLKSKLIAAGKAGALGHICLQYIVCYPSETDRIKSLAKKAARMAGVALGYY